MPDNYLDLLPPNLRDEADNHVLEIAVAAGAQTIVTYNRADFLGAELHFPGLHIVVPADLLKGIWYVRCHFAHPGWEALAA